MNGKKPAADETEIGFFFSIVELVSGADQSRSRSRSRNGQVPGRARAIRSSASSAASRTSKVQMESVALARKNSIHLDVFRRCRWLGFGLQMKTDETSPLFGAANLHSRAPKAAAGLAAGNRIEVVVVVGLARPAECCTVVVLAAQ